MSRKQQAWTRKKLHRARLRKEAEARSEAKLQRQAEKELNRDASSMEAAMKGCAE